MFRKNLLVVYAVLTVVGCPVFGHANVPIPREKASNLRVAETALSKLGYWIVKVDGKADASTRHAIMAFQKVEGRKRTGVLSAADLKALRSAQPPVARHQTGAAHMRSTSRARCSFSSMNRGASREFFPSHLEMRRNISIKVPG